MKPCKYSRFTRHNQFLLCFLMEFGWQVIILKRENERERERERERKCMTTKTKARVVHRCHRVSPCVVVVS